MTRADELALKSVIHQLILKWDSDGILIGLRKNSAYIQRDLFAAIKQFIAAKEHKP